MKDYVITVTFTVSAEDSEDAISKATGHVVREDEIVEIEGWGEDEDEGQG